jgi:hypothetical protein
MPDREPLPDDLERVAALVPRALPATTPPPGLRERTLAAVAAAAELDGLGALPAVEPVRPRRRPGLRVLAPALAGIAAALAALVLTVGGGAELEARAELAGGGAAATVELTELPIGRVIDLRSDSLPVLPRGEFYELWFATRDDRPGAPDRISAGTWHPDAEGSSVVRFTGAVDPARNPIVVITREPADGDPAPSGREVLRGPAGDA